MAFEAFVASFGYVGVFVLVFAINIVPLLMPPTWLFISTLYFLYPQYFTPSLLAVTAAFASTSGRIVLSYMGTLSRRVMKEERKRSMGRVGQALKRRKYGGFLLSFLYALSPFPSNVYFLSIGMMQCQCFSVFFGFWLGRLISYWALIHGTYAAFQSFSGIFESQLHTVIIADSLGIASMIIFVCVDWEKLIKEKRLVLIKPKFSL